MNSDQSYSMADHFGNASASSSTSSWNSSSHDTEDDHTIAKILEEEENSINRHRLGRRLSHLDSIPHTPRINNEIPDANDATFDHQRLSASCILYVVCGYLMKENLKVNSLSKAHAQALSGFTDWLATYGLSELRIEGDGNCQFRALADQLFRNPDYHKHVRKQVVKQLKHFRKLYEGYVPMKYKVYLKKMKKLGEWGDHVTLQAAADRFGAKICLVTSFRDTCYIEILPKDQNPSREIWLSFWSEVHYNSLYETGEVPSRPPKKKHWLF